MSDPVTTLHGEVDALAARLADHHRARMQCRRGCASCCVDDISVFEIEAERIRAEHAELLASGEPHPRGACAFLDTEGACRVYADRPYVCRTQGLPLRWIDDDAIERRDICPLNEPGPPLETLRAGECWTIGPAEARLHALQTRRGQPVRVRLRDLFTRR